MKAGVRVRATRPNPVQVTLVGESKPSHEGTMNFLDNRLDVSTGTLRGRAVIPNRDLSILPGQFRPGPADRQLAL
jgi:multidrug efflux pump subunit AcrA (membrane-fusion protein)